MATKPAPRRGAPTRRRGRAAGGAVPAGAGQAGQHDATGRDAAPRHHHPAALAGDRPARRRAAEAGVRSAAGQPAGRPGRAARRRAPRPARDRCRGRRGRPLRGGLRMDGQVGAAPRGRADRDPARGGPAPGDRVGRRRGRGRRADGWRICRDTPGRWPGSARRLPRCCWSSTTPNVRGRRDRVPGGSEHPRRALCRSRRRSRSCSTGKCRISCCWRPTCRTETVPPSPASSARIRGSGMMPIVFAGPEDAAGAGRGAPGGCGRLSRHAGRSGAPAPDGGRARPSGDAACGSCSSATR